MGWVGQEYKDRLRSRQHAQTGGLEIQFEDAARQRWSQLVEELESDFREFVQQGGHGEFIRASSTQVRIRNSDASLVLIISADVEAHSIHYDFTSTAERIASPEGGIFSMRPSRWGRAELYSADQRINSEAVRRLLLEPILFPPEAAA